MKRFRRTDLQSSTNDEDFTFFFVKKAPKCGEQKRALAPDPGAFPPGGKSGDFSGGARGRPGADLAIWPNLAPRRLF